MRVQGVVLAMMWCGCGPLKMEPTLRCPSSMSDAPIEPPRTAVVGRSTDQLLRIRCQPPGATGSGVTIIVTDQSGNEQPFTSDPAVLDGTFTMRVSFVPNAPGIWEIRAFLEPELGLMFAERVIVMGDRTEALPIATATVPNAQSCTSIDWADGLVACGTFAKAQIFLDGGLLAEEPNARFLSAGNILWSWNGTKVTRWEGPNRIDFPTYFISTPAPVVGDSRHLEVTDYDGLWEIALASDGGTTLERRALLTDAGVPHEDVLAVDGGWLWPRGDDMCFRGESGPTQCAPFLNSFQHLVGAEGDGFWLNGVRLSFVRFGAGPTPISTLSTDLPYVFSSNTPLQVAEYGPIAVNRTTVTLDRWPDFPADLVTARYFFGLRGDQVSVFER